MNEVQVLSPYEFVVKEIREGNLDPFDIDLGYLIELFKREAENLKEWEYFEEAGRFLEASAKLLKFQVESVFFSSTPHTHKRKRVTIREIRDVLKEESEGTDYDLSFLYEYTYNVGRPRGVKDAYPRMQEETQLEEVEKVPLHKQVNYHELAKEVRERIKKGMFEIKSIRDFIAYLYAFLEYEDVPELKV